MGAFGDGKSKTASKRKAAPGKELWNAEFKGYINLTLSDAEKAEFVAWLEAGYSDAVLEHAVADGVNIALKADPKGAGCLASATQRRPSSVNAGLVVTARGRSASQAWGRVLFCLSLLYQSERWEDTQPMADPDRW